MTPEFLVRIATIAGITFVIPVVVALYCRVRSAPLKIIAAYTSIAFAQSLYLVWLASHGIHNLWLMHLFIPVQAGMFLWALALWQTREIARTAVLLTIPLYLAAWIVLTLTVESFSTFPRFVKIFEGLLVIAVASYTLVTRSQHISGPITSYPWFWVGAALVIYLSFGAIVNPVSSLLLPYAPERVLIMSGVNSVLLMVCNVCFARAMVTASARLRAGGVPAAAT
ncbi:MAG TPA: hypothetical protein VF037_03845 [Gemmatimonadales bacterium]